MMDIELEELVFQLREVAAKCFPEVPNYQALSGDHDELERVVLTVARNQKNKIIGFCSALILEVDGVGKIFHTGLTCVDPSARGKKLTHKLTSKTLTTYMIRESLLKPVWVTNCACVLSSLGNVAMYFEDVFPSPYRTKAPSSQHLRIAQAISEQYREQIAINETAIFNDKSFVFEGSVEGTLFEKKENDDRFHHRNRHLTKFYQDLMNFERGDEVLQIGKVSFLTFAKYAYKKALKRNKIRMENISEEMQNYAS